MDWGSAIGGFIVGLTSGYVVKVAIDARRSTKISQTQAKDSQGVAYQAGNLAGGDLAGRDVNKGPE